ncbi:single-stranded-DNA-specific exonuclease RecJ, partial [Patescibacteria group bacterium]|nr:single-stranded-DNA-specific exonuclease RecJ [Patescibacteria group bacterium]
LVLVYGDYDADGISASAIVWETLHDFKINTLPYLPQREEGYGINAKVLARLKKEKPNLGLVVTVDQGVVAHEEIKKAKKMGIEVIVTDHHQLKKTLPAAVAIIHTTQMCGAGVAWFFARELVKKWGQGARAVKERLGLAAIGTVTDLLPVTGVNRSILVHGLSQLEKTSRVGLETLRHSAGIEERKLGTYELGFMIGPRLNSAGRVGDAMNGLRLLCSTDKVRSRRLATGLEETNLARQQLMTDLAFEARELWLKKKSKAKLIFVTGEGWSEGVIGLAASRLTEEFYLPSVVVAKDGAFARGSARSIKGFDITRAMRQFENLLVDAGGHPMAAGFTIKSKNIPQFKKKLVEYAGQKLAKRKLEKTLRVEALVEIGDLDQPLFYQLEKFAPFGVGNPRPCLAVRKARVVQARQLGADKNHLKLILSSDLGLEAEAIGFRMGKLFDQVSPGQQVDAAFDLQINEWRGTKKLQLRVKDLRL